MKFFIYNIIIYIAISKNVYRRNHSYNFYYFIESAICLIYTFLCFIVGKKKRLVKKGKVVSLRQGSAAFYRTRTSFLTKKCSEAATRSKCAAVILK